MLTKINLRKEGGMKTMQKLLAGAMICGVGALMSCSDKDKPGYGFPTDKIDKKVVGRWVMTEIDGKVLPTNGKEAFTIYSAQKGFLSTAFGNKIWLNKAEFKLEIEENVLYWSVQPNENVQSLHRHAVEVVTDNELDATSHAIVIDNGDTIKNVGPIRTRFTRVTDDFAKEIVGTWEGKLIVEQEEPAETEKVAESKKVKKGKKDKTVEEVQPVNVEELHRWQYNTDGTFAHYVKNGENWDLTPNTTSEYFVYGKLLCSHWADSTGGDSECWDIEIKDDAMKWAALRVNEDGSLYSTSLDLMRVPDEVPAETSEDVSAETPAEAPAEK